MIREWLASLGAKTASPAARRLGAVRELAALQVRHSRCAAAWAQHLEQTRQAILTAARPHASPDRAALIVGAGLLFDIPLAELVGLFRRVYLVDVVFLRGTCRFAQTFGESLSLKCTDVTGAFDAVMTVQDLPELRPIPGGLPAHVMTDVDWVLSVNCLTQLPLLPARWLLLRGFPDDQVERFGQDIIRSHLDWLASTGKPWCLITEQRDTRLDRHGRAIGGSDYGPLMAEWLDAQGARPIADWSWPVHPAGELPAGETESRQVFAWQGSPITRR